MKYFDGPSCPGPDSWGHGDGWMCVPDSQVMEDALREEQKALEQFYKSRVGFSDFNVRVEMLSDRQYQIFLEDKKENTMSMSAEEYALREGLDMWQVRVDRGFRGEFKAWEGHDESEDRGPFASWCDAPNVDKVGLYVNGNLARPIYVRRREEVE